MGPHPQDLRHHAVDRARHGLLLQQLKEREGASTGPPDIMPNAMHAANAATVALIEHLIDNAVITQDDVYDDLQEELSDIIYSAITITK